MKIYTEMDVNTVYVILGLHCNFNCKYCSQKFKKYAVGGKMVEDKVINYIKRLVELRPEHKKPLTVMFWGGEPLVYIDTIKDIIDKLKGTDVRFGTVTNGSLMTQELVNYFNNHEVAIAISNDGINTEKTRGINVLENKEKLALYKQLDLVGIDSVISAYNSNFLRTIEYVREKFGRDVGVGFEWLMCSKDTVPSLYDFNYTEFDRSSREYFNTLRSNILDGIVDSMLIRAMPDINKVLKLNMNNLYPHCGAMRHTVNIDLDGNVYACHPGECLGSIDDEHEELLQRYEDNFNNAFNYADCSRCECVYICKAGCPLELPSKGKLAVCKAKKIFYSNLLNFVKSFGGELNC